MSGTTVGPSASHASMVALRARWPYQLGAIGAGVATLGFLFASLLGTFTMAGALTPQLVVLAPFCVFAGTTMMAIAWGSLVLDGVVGAGPAIGSGAMPLALLIAIVDHSR